MDDKNKYDLEKKYGKIRIQNIVAEVTKKLETIKLDEKINNFLKKELINNTEIKNAYFSSSGHLYGYIGKATESTTFKKTNCKTLFLKIIKLKLRKNN